MFIEGFSAHRACFATKIPSLAIRIIWTMVQFVGVDPTPGAFFATTKATVDFLAVSSDASLGGALSFLHEFYNSRVLVDVHLQERANDVAFF